MFPIQFHPEFATSTIVGRNHPTAEPEVTSAMGWNQKPKADTLNAEMPKPVAVDFRAAMVAARESGPDAAALAVT
jgi:hypothetical protein